MDEDDADVSLAASTGSRLESPVCEVEAEGEDRAAVLPLLVSLEVGRIPSAYVFVVVAGAVRAV